MSTSYEKPTDELRQVMGKVRDSHYEQCAEDVVIKMQRKWLVQDGKVFDMEVGHRSGIPKNHHSFGLSRWEPRSDEDEYPHREWYKLCKVRAEWRDLPMVEESQANV